MFHFSLNASTIRPTPLLEKIRIAAACGYEGIELWHMELDEFERSGGSLTDLRRRLEDARLRVPSTINLKNWFESDRDDGPEWDECRRRMQQAVDVGAMCIVAGPPLVTTDWERGIRNFQRLLRLGKEIGINPAMEFLGFVEQVNTLESALEIIDRSGDPQAQLVLDPFHIFRGAGDFASVQKLRGSQIAVCHINDAAAEPPAHLQKDADRVMIGEGILDLKKMIWDLDTIGYEGFISLELFSEDLWRRDPHELAKLGLDRMQTLVAELSP
ncbi:MAG: sugar phosphate isomerase/epimerase [Planctomycetales bacterium]